MGRRSTDVTIPANTSVVMDVDGDDEITDFVLNAGGTLTISAGEYTRVSWTTLNSQGTSRQ